MPSMTTQPIELAVRSQHGVLVAQTLQLRTKHFDFGFELEHGFILF